MRKATEYLSRPFYDSDAFYLDRILSYKELKHEERICEEGVYFIKEGRIKITEETYR